MNIDYDIECLQYLALESSILCDPEDYGLPDEKKYPMPDKKHVLLAIKFFNSTEDPEKQKTLAANINKRIKDFNMESEVNAGDKNRFKKYWKPTTESTIDPNSDVLYHGSNKLTKVIQPHKSTHGTSEVYACADRDFALCYSGKQWNDFNISQAYYNGELILTEIEEGAFNKFFDCPGYIYTVSKDNFTKINNREYVCHTSVPVISSVRIDNVLSELKRLKVKMYKYPDLPPFIKSRKDYIKKKEEFFNGDKQSLKDEISKSYKGNEAVITSVSPIVPYTSPALKKAESVDDPLLMRFPIKKKKEAMVAKEFKSVILESTLKSDLDADYKSKGNLSLSNFKKVKVSEITKEMKESPVNFLKHIDDKRDATYIWKCNDDIVGVGSVRYNDINYNWITAVQINPKYRGYGLGNQILDFCVKELNGNALTVATDNQVALRMYKKYGFKISNESLADVKAGRRKVYFMYLNTNDAPNFPIIKSKNKYFIKDENGKKIAELGYYDYSKKDFNWVLFADIETDMHYRNQGLGSKLLNRAYSDVIKDNPKNGVYLMVRPDNKVAISFYKKNGFEFVKSVKIKDEDYDLMCKGNADKKQLLNTNHR